MHVLVTQGSLDELRGAAHTDSAESLEDIFLRLTGGEGEEERALAHALRVE